MPSARAITPVTRLPERTQVAVVGAGVGGLATAAELARRGVDVTVLEAHVYPGGCAGTFYHKGFRFDAGATLAGGFAPGAPMDLVGERLGIAWGAKLAERAMVVHLPDGTTVTRWTDATRWAAERRAHFGAAAEPFWRWQERTADGLWDLAGRLPPWPPQTGAELARLAHVGLGWLGDRVAAAGPLAPLQLARDAWQPVAARLPHGSDAPALRLFVDAQLLIAAQTTSAEAYGLYGATALDLARQGVGHVAGGMGALAERLAEAVRRNGGVVHFRQPIEHVERPARGPITLRAKRGRRWRADAVVFNLPPWNIAPLLGDAAPDRLARLGPLPHDGWGAFMTYVGLDAARVPPDTALHHQIVTGRPLAEGRSVFLSLSPAWDDSRAPDGQRTLTISTHTALEPWWTLFERDRDAYEARKAAYSARLLAAAERALPGLRDAAALVLPGTPVTFRRFTRRHGGWVGGFPQTHLLRAWGPRLADRLWLVGDTIFPGQSVPAVALGGLRVAEAVSASLVDGARRRSPSGRRLAAGPERAQRP